MRGSASKPVKTICELYEGVRMPEEVRRLAATTGLAVSPKGNLDL